MYKFLVRLYASLPESQYNGIPELLLIFQPIFRDRKNSKKELLSRTSAPKLVLYDLRWRHQI